MLRRCVPGVLVGCLALVCAGTAQAAPRKRKVTLVVSVPAADGQHAAARRRLTVGP